MRLDGRVIGLERYRQNLGVLLGLWAPAATGGTATAATSTAAPAVLVSFAPAALVAAHARAAKRRAREDDEPAPESWARVPTDPKFKWEAL